MRFYAIIIRPNDKMIVFPHGVGTASPSLSLGFSLIPSTSSVKFFIGIVGFSSVDGCLRMGTNGDNSKVSSSSSAISVSYNCFQIFYKSVVLNKVRILAFVNKIQYFF